MLYTILVLFTPCQSMFIFSLVPDVFSFYSLVSQTSGATLLDMFIHKARDCAINGITNALIVCLSASMC